MRKFILATALIAVGYTCEVPPANSNNGDSRSSSMFCAHFGAFCGFDPETFDSISACRDAFPQLTDDDLVCAMMNIDAAKSGDEGGCASISDLDPCAFTPGPKKPLIAETIYLPREYLYAQTDAANTWQCDFHPNPVLVDEGQQLIVSGKVSVQVYPSIQRPDVGGAMAFSVREVGDNSEGEILQRTEFGGETSVGENPGIATTPPLAAGLHEIGVCVIHELPDPEGHAEAYYSQFLSKPIAVTIINPP